MPLAAVRAAGQRQFELLVDPALPPLQHLHVGAAGDHDPRRPALVVGRDQRHHVPRRLDAGVLAHRHGQLQWDRLAGAERKEHRRTG
jgi:hypothetical protein